MPDFQVLNKDFSYLDNINFANDHTFALMRPPFKLDYRSTSDNWRKVVLENEN